MVQSKIKATLLIELRPHLIRDTRVLAGWVCPAGGYYKGGSWRHESLAGQITGAKNGTKLLEDEGWVRLTDYGHPVIGDDHYFTQAQINTLLDLANLHPTTEFGKRLLSALSREEMD